MVAPRLLSGCRPLSRRPASAATTPGATKIDILRELLVVQSARLDHACSRVDQTLSSTSAAVASSVSFTLASVALYVAGGLVSGAAYYGLFNSVAKLEADVSKMEMTLKTDMSALKADMSMVKADVARLVKSKQWW